MATDKQSAEKEYTVEEKYNIDTTQIKEPKDLESVFETVKARH